MAVVATDLPSTVEESLSMCPKFRILVVGNTGVGKSSLISRVFNISLEDIDVAHNRAGKADVEFAYASEENSRFILHDSQGFEPGETNNWDIVEKFIHRRSAIAEFKDRVHVIWLCIEMPRTGAREVEVGDERLLSLADELKIPIIIVFTKFDILVSEHARKAQKLKVPKSQILEASRKKAEEDFTTRIESWSKRQAPCARISTKDKYMDTLRELAEVTSRSLRGAEEAFSRLSTSQPFNIHQAPGVSGLPSTESQRTNAQQLPEGAVARQEVGTRQEAEQSLSSSVTGQQASRNQDPEALSLLWVATQQVNPRQKVEESIRQGYYWINLGRSTVFRGRRLIECLSRIGQDILKVWNISDPNKLLSQIEFFAEIISLLDEFSSGLKTDHGNEEGPLQRDPSMISLTRRKGLAFAQMFGFLYRTYRAIPETAQYLGAYIIDLTLVLHRIFMATLATRPRRVVSKELIDQELQNYKDQQASFVHLRVRGISVGPAGFERKIADLIRESLGKNQVGQS